MSNSNSTWNLIFVYSAIEVDRNAKSSKAKEKRKACGEIKYILFISSDGDASNQIILYLNAAKKIKRDRLICIIFYNTYLFYFNALYFSFLNKFYFYFAIQSKKK